MAKINFKKITDRVQTAVVMGAGSVASNYVGNFINKQFGSKATPVVTAGAKLVVGAVLPSLVGGGSKKAGMVHDFANGMLAEAAVSMAKALNLPGVSGIEPETISDNWTAGGTVNGTDNPAIVSGAAN